MASKKMKYLAGDKKPTPPTRQITNLADGVTYGMAAFGDGLFRGIKGVVSKPLKGAQKKGAQGFVKGLYHGVVGVVANPVSGALDAVSIGLYGIIATVNSLAGGYASALTRVSFR